MIYEIACDKTVRPDKLHGEISAALSGILIPTIEFLSSSIKVTSLVELSPANLSTIAGVIAAHSVNSTEDAVESSIRRAVDFGNELARKFAVENVMMGITQAGKTKAVTDACHKLDHYLKTGSLYAAMAEIDSMIADITIPLQGLSPFITDERLLTYKGYIEGYLGL